MPAQQTPQELMFISDHWFANFAPKGLLNNDYNGQLIHDEILRRGSTVLTFELMSDIVRSLGDKLQYEGAPAPQAAKQPAVKDWKRGPRPAKVVDVNAERDDFIADMENPDTLLFAKLQNEAQHEVDKAIQDCTYQNIRGRIDWPLTNQRRDILRNIRVVRPSKNARGEAVILWTETLAQIRAKLTEFDREDRQRDYIR